MQPITIPTTTLMSPAWTGLMELPFQSRDPKDSEFNGLPLCSRSLMFPCRALMSLLIRYAHIPFYFCFSFAFSNHWSTTTHLHSNTTAGECACAHTTIALTSSDQSCLFVLERNIVRCYSNLKLNILTRNCIGSLRSQDLCKWYHTNCRLVMRSSKSY